MELISLLEEELKLYRLNSIYRQILNQLRYSRGFVDVATLVAQTLIILDSDSKSSRDTLLELLINKDNK